MRKRLAAQKAKSKKSGAAAAALAEAQARAKKGKGKGKDSSHYNQVCHRNPCRAIVICCQIIMQQVHHFLWNRNDKPGFLEALLQTHVVWDQLASIRSGTNVTLLVCTCMSWGCCIVAWSHAFSLVGDTQAMRLPSSVVIAAISAWWLFLGHSNLNHALLTGYCMDMF